ncbi:MAG: hypothetical protein EAZ61_08535 [Oscillatoriales cyanobacterium]|nr:MAG: hypothetical protein EAZ61_08535 [Oscillatoriales cyanobacterium]
MLTSEQSDRSKKMSSKRAEQKTLEGQSKEELIALVRRLLEEIEEVKQTSQTSSKPPSNEILTWPERKTRKNSEELDNYKLFRVLIAPSCYEA